MNAIDCLGLPMIAGDEFALVATFGRSLTQAPWSRILLWVGFMVVAIGVVSLSGTRWGRRNQTEKAVGLSVLAHVVLIGFAATIHVVTPRPLPPGQPTAKTVQVNIVRWEPEEDETTPSDEGAPTPWDADGRSWTNATPAPDATAHDVTPPLVESDRPPRDEPSPPEPLPAELREPDASTLPELALERHEPPETHVVARPVQRDIPWTPSPWSPVADATADPPTPPVLTAPTMQRPIDPPTTVSSGDEPLAANASPTAMPLAPSTPSLAHIEAPSLVGRRHMTDASSSSMGEPVMPHLPARVSAVHRENGHTVPEWYRMRLVSNRLELSKPFGATPDSEAAVRSAIAWLAAVQSQDGRWDADAHGAGREQYVAGRYREGAGLHADTGVTGLALLAFLGAGHTHQYGGYQDTVQRGLKFLLRSQSVDGALAGDATHYARMYCHAMATIALCEAYNLTGDPALRRPAERAIAFTIGRQNRLTGGWRYAEGEDGDMSQFGWQMLVVKTARAGSFDVPDRVFVDARRYLEQASQGNAGGLAAYRTGYRVSHPMTAEAMLCRLLTGESATSHAVREATAAVMQQPPGVGPVNLYYWYYATLALQQTQNDDWRRWNTALQHALLSGQEKTGAATGSWPPDTVWGGYGGRVYSTAMASLSLEASYRFAPPGAPRVALAPTEIVPARPTFLR